MAIVTALTAERMLEIEGASIVDGEVVGDSLLLTRFDETTINAGNVRGPQGTAGPAGANATLVPAWTAVNFLVQGAIQPGILVPPAPIPVRSATQTVKIIGLRGSILGPTDATATIVFRRNGVALAEQLPTPADVDASSLTLITPIVLAHLDLLDFTCTAETGSPNDLSATIILEHSAV